MNTVLCPECGKTLRVIDGYASCRHGEAAMSYFTVWPYGPVCSPPDVVSMLSLMRDEIGHACGNLDTIKEIYWKNFQELNGVQTLLRTGMSEEKVRVLFRAVWDNEVKRNDR